MARPTKLTPEAQARDALDTILLAAFGGDNDATAWLSGECSVHVDKHSTGDYTARIVYSGTEDRGLMAILWSRAVLARDGYRCADCGASGTLNAHHIKPWAQYPDERYVLSNGVALCIPCHAKRHPRHAALILRQHGRE